MNNLEFQLRGVGDPRLAVHATSALPAWLWSVDGTRVLWANPVGARLFGAANAATLAAKTFGPADSHRRQVAQLAGRLPPSGALRLERLRGFGANLGTLVTCGCARLDFADGSHGVLVAAAEPVGRAMPLVERLQRLVEGIDSPIAAFARDGMFIGASDAARSLLGFHDLSEAGLGQARNDALKQGRVELPVGIGHLVLQRVGSGADIGLVALIATGPTTAARSRTTTPATPVSAPPLEPVQTPVATPEQQPASEAETAAPTPAHEIEPPPAVAPMPEYEQPAWSNEAPAEFALIDEFAEQPAESPIVAGKPSEPEPAIDVHHAEPLSQESSSSVEARTDEPDEPPASPSEAPAEFASIEESAGQAAELPLDPDEASEPDLQSVLQLDVPHAEAPHGPVSPEPASADDVDHAAPSTQEPPFPQPSPPEPSPPEPSPYVEAVADESLPSHATSPAPAGESSSAIKAASTEGLRLPPAARAPSWTDEPLPAIRQHPLRFMWQMDADGRFSIGSDEFTRLIGSHTAAGFGRSWSDIAETFGLDPDGRVLKAVATRDTWSGITLNWPVDGGGRLPVELSGLPTFDRDRQFAGYRGFGVCRDLDGLARLAALRRYELFSAAPAPRALSAGIASAGSAGQGLPADTDLDLSGSPESSAAATLEPSTPVARETSQQTDLETSVETLNETPNETARATPQNVVPFRSIGEPKSPVLSPVENSAFNELARQLAERLEREHDAPAEPSLPETAEAPQAPDAIAEQPATAETAPAGAQPDWLAHPEPPARGESRRDRTLLDLLPMGVLIYRLDRLLYANPAFLARMGYRSLQALEEAGGLDALYVEPGVSSASSTSDTGTPVTISAGEASSQQGTPSAADARLYTISWDDDSALALIFSGMPTPAADAAAAIAEPVVDPVLEPVAVAEPSPVGHANAEELGAILDTTAEGILMFDAEGNINSCNRSAEALFGHDGAELVQRNLADLFAPESRAAVQDYLASIKGADIASLLEHGRDVLAQVRGGGLIPVSITIGRTQAHGPNFFAVFRDLSQSKKSESELREAQRLMDRAGNAKADMLARISHEVRTPLNAIIGFAEVMIGERFGALGNERYVEYMKDIRASGERVIAIINDLLDLSRIETGKLDLAFANQNLNDLVEQCVAGMQPQANRERIIIRTSLAHALPPVVADARALRQITLNLIGNSIHLARAGGQVIVSTALSDSGEVVLRVRDTGHGLNDNEVAAAMEPFRNPAPSDQSSDSSGVNLSLTKALVEANRAQFQIRTGGRSGTLIEVVFPHAMARA